MQNTPCSWIERGNTKINQFPQVDLEIKCIFDQNCSQFVCMCSLSKENSKIYMEKPRAKNNQDILKEQKWVKFALSDTKNSYKALTTMTLSYYREERQIINKWNNFKLFQHKCQNFKLKLHFIG